MSELSYLRWSMFIIRVAHEMKSFLTNQAVLALFIVVAVLAPFLHKAFHIDDPLFIWMAQQISHHPGDPYGFAVNWSSFARPMFSVMQNPPLNSYYMALAARFFGWSEFAMHSAFLAPAIAAILGTFFLGRRLSRSPLLAALLTLFTPVFLVSATNIMSDVWLLALWVWSIECWLSGLERNSRLLLALASILIAAAALTKYFGLCLVPLLALYALAHERRFKFQFLFLIIPLLTIVVYEMVTAMKYEHGLFSAAILYPWTRSADIEKPFVRQFLTGLSFLGGCFVSVLFFLPLIRIRKVIIIGAFIFVLLLPLFYFFFGRSLSSQVGTVAVTIEGALFAVTAVGILVLAWADLAQRKTSDSLLLFCWVVGIFVFATFMNWSITARTFLPIAPALAILLVRKLDLVRLERKIDISVWWPLLPAALVSVLLAVADYNLANTARTASSQLQQRFRFQLATIEFQGHWGFQYYMEQWGPKPLEEQRFMPIAGDIMVIPANNTSLFALPPENVGLIEELNYPQPLWLTTMSRGGIAGFYSSVWGPLPWAFTQVLPERYSIVRFK